MHSKYFFFILISCLSLTAFSQKVEFKVTPEDADMHMNSVKVRNPKTVNISDPNIIMIAQRNGYATQGLRTFDLRGEDLSEYTFDLLPLVKPKEDFKSAKIEFTKLIDRSGKVEKPSVYMGMYGTSEGTDLDDSRFTTALNNMMSKWGYNVKGVSTMFKEEKNTPDFGLGGEILWFAKGTAGSGFQISLLIKWSLYSLDEEKVVFEKTVGAYSNTGSTSRFNDELVYTLEDGLKSLIGDPEFTKVVEEGAVSKEVEEFEALVIQKMDGRSEMSYGDIIKTSMKSTVTVKTSDGHGSGFIISEEGYILTNDHVVHGATKIEVIFDQGFSLNAELVRSDKKRDVALLKIPGSGYKPLPLMENSSTSGIGSDVVVIGTPRSTDLGQTVTKGIVSGQREFEKKSFIQTDVAINAGKSGGPLIDSKSGMVMGVVVAKVMEKGVEGLGFAIPIEDCCKKLNIQIK